MSEPTMSGMRGIRTPPTEPIRESISKKRQQKEVGKTLLRSIIPGFKQSDDPQGKQKHIWLEPELYNKPTTANLDDQIPATIYYLGRILNIPEISEVYVESSKRRRKHWTVIEERDYEVMDRIYDIEIDTKRRFPASNISFRVTVSSDNGPSVSHVATKIYESE